MEERLELLQSYVIPELGQLILQYVGVVGKGSGLTISVQAKLVLTRCCECERDFGHIIGTYLPPEMSSWEQYYAYLVYMFTAHAPIRDYRSTTVNFGDVVYGTYNAWIHGVREGDVEVFGNRISRRFVMISDFPVGYYDHVFVGYRIPFDASRINLHVDQGLVQWVHNICYILFRYVGVHYCIVLGCIDDVYRFTELVYLNRSCDRCKLVFAEIGVEYKLTEGTMFSLEG